LKALPSEIESSLPAPLWDAYQAFMREDETQPFRKVHRFIDLIEVFSKLYTAASMATFLHALRNRIEQDNSSISEESFTKIKVMLAAGLKTPSLGIWWKFARDISAILKELNIPHILKGAEKELLSDKSSIKKAFDGNNNLIAFRNTYAHGATPSDAACKKDLEELWPRMLQLLTDAVSLRETKLVICTAENSCLHTTGSRLEHFNNIPNPMPGHVWFCSDRQTIDAYPILSFKLKDENVDFFFYNDLKDKYANYLNYPNAEHLKDANLKQELLQYIPIEDWKKIGSLDMEPFRQQVEMLTEVFKGRRKELDNIAAFLADDNYRFLCIWGPPGVGKSALLARLTQVARCNPEIRETINEGNQWHDVKLHLVDYFIRRGATETASQFFDSVNQRLDQLFNLRFDIGKSDTEKHSLFLARLEQVSKQLKDGERLLLILDGLDEIKLGDPLMSLLPKLLPEKVQMIYGARPQQELRFTFYEQLDRERKTYFDLGGLSLPDIRAVLMEHVSKYEMQQSYVEAVLRISEGNPLYLKMLCRGLEQNIYKLNQVGMLPKGMDELYQAALLRLENENAGSINFLMYLSAAKDFVSAELAASWMSIDTPTLKNRMLYACLEFLYENPLTEGLEDYQLFHESLREYLSKTYTVELNNCKERICNWSLAWISQNGDLSYNGELLSYAMHFSTEHIFESYLNHRNAKRFGASNTRRVELFDLVGNESWRQINFETCGNGESLSMSFYFLQRILALEDPKGEQVNNFIAYAYNRYAEPLRMYELQRKLLLQPVKHKELKALFERTPSLAKMGERNEDKVLLAMLPLWSNEPQGSIPIILENKVSEWLENTRNSAVKKLWIQTKQKRIISDAFSRGD
jgi:hypothetical protein